MSDKKESSTLSVEFSQKVSDAKKRKTAITKKAAEIDEALNLKRKHRDSIKANGGNPDQDIQTLDSERKDVDRRQQVAKSEIDELHLEQKNKLVADKANCLRKNYERIVEPRKRRIQNAEAQLETVLAECAAAIIGDQSEDPEIVAEAERIDADIEAFIESAIECGVPGNYRLTKGDKPGKARASGAEEDVRKFRQRVNELMEKFRKDAEAAWKKNNPEQAKLLLENQRTFPRPR